MHLQFLSPRHFAAGAVLGTFEAWAAAASRPPSVSASPSPSQLRQSLLDGVDIRSPRCVSPKTGRKHLGWPD